MSCSPTTVVNIYHVNKADPDVVYIGRGSEWGNPFKMGGCTNRSRDDVVEMYRPYLWGRIKNGVVTKEMLIALDGKRLACYCAPKRCHGDVILAAIEWAKREDCE